MNHQPNTPASINEAVKAFDAFLCRAWGETDLPSAELVPDWEGVRRFMVREWLGEVHALNDDDTVVLDQLKEDFDAHEEDQRGGEFTVEFEIGGVSIERVCGFAAPGAAIDAREQEVPTHQLLDWLKEGEANAMHLAKTSPDRDGWLEDAKYFSAAATKVWESADASERQALEKVSSLLTSMFASARAHVQGADEIVVGYTVRTGALHKIVGILASYKPVIIPSNLPTAHETITGILTGTSAPRQEAPPASAQGSPELLLGWKRYEKARKLSPFQWNRLHIRNLAGENFDAMIDSLPEPTTPVPIPSEALSPATVAQPVGDWKLEALRTATPYCISCEREGHWTHQCHSTHGFNTPRDMEMARLSWIAAGYIPAQPCAAQGCGGAVRQALKQIIEADDAQALTQQLIDIGRAALSADKSGGA
jgi:hypothetical protein